MQDVGVNKLFYTLSADFFPHINPTSIAPQDIMHNFPRDGVTRHEAAWLLYSCTRGTRGNTYPYRR
jgi:hypothetical protein